MRLSTTAFITSLASFVSASEEVVIAGEPVPGTVVNHLPPLCQKWSGGRGYTPTKLIPDKSCVTVPGLSLEIQKPATCANGTLARIALFDDKRCNHGEVTREDGFITVTELDDYCLDNRGANYGSMMFYCDGPTPKEHKPDENDDKDEGPAVPLGPKKGSLSDNSCPVRGQPMRMPTFKHPEPDKCVNVPAHRQVKVYHPAVCADGRPAEFVRYSGYGCQGEPAEKKMIEGNSECMSLSEMDQFESSVAFVCDGVKQGAVRVNDNDNNNNNKSGIKGSVLGLVLVLVLIVSLTLLSCALACLRSVNIVTKIMSIFRSNEGQISLS